MMYYAKVNTADPRVGLITVGEYLTDAQASALGEDLLEKLVARGVLGRDAGSDGADNANNGAAEDAPEDTSDDGDGVPELNVADVVVNDAQSEAPKGRRKNK